MTIARVEQTDSTRPESGEMARHIASTAARLFSERGYDATSVREIVEAAGVTKPTLYYHFRSKEGLAHALVTAPLNDLAETIRRIERETEDPVEALRSTMQAQFAFCRENPDRARFIYTLLFGPLVAGLAKELSEFKQRSNECLSGIATRLVEAGVVEASRVSRFLLSCRGALIALTFAYLYSDQDVEVDLPRQVVGDLLRGFAASGSTETGS